jgi:hypothetical protein
VTMMTVCDWALLGIPIVPSHIKILLQTQALAEVLANAEVERFSGCVSSFFQLIPILTMGDRRLPNRGEQWT